MGVVMCAEVRQLIFTADKVRSRRHFPGTLEFNVPVVLTHLLGNARFVDLRLDSISPTLLHGFRELYNNSQNNCLPFVFT